jgi:hypothetical protein
MEVVFSGRFPSLSNFLPGWFDLEKARLSIGEPRFRF